MNKKAGIGLAVLSAIGIFIVGFMFINFLMPEITQFRTNMSCSDVNNIYNGTKILCLITDAVVPYYILLVVSIGLGAITSRLVL